MGRFFFQSPEVCQKLGRQPEFLATGDFTTVAARVRGSWRLHRTSVRVFDSRRLRKTAIISCCQRGKRKKKKRRKGVKEEKKGRKRREKERKGEKKGRRRKGKEGKREYADSVGGCVGRFFFQSPEVCQKLGRQPEFLATGLNSYATRTHAPEDSQYSLSLLTFSENPIKVYRHENVSIWEGSMKCNDMARLADEMQIFYYIPLTTYTHTGFENVVSCVSISLSV